MIAVETVYGRDGVYSTPYLTRIKLLGGLTQHVFHRGDADPDPHDHLRAFLTLPLTSYVEEVYDPATGAMRLNLVRAGRLYFRPAAYAHRVRGRWTGKRLPDGRPSHSARLGKGSEIVTLVLWLGRKRSTWGFWVQDPWVGVKPLRRFVPWRTYIFGEAE